MQRILLFLFSIALCAASAVAIPARRGVMTVQQPDGTSLSFLLHGDETCSYRTTTDGYPIVRNAQGAYVYALPTTQGEDGGSQFFPSTILAHNPGQRSATEVQFLAQLQPEQIAQLMRSELAERNGERHAFRVKRHTHSPMHRRVLGLDPGTANPVSTIGSGSAVRGKKKGLIILAEFQDVKMKTRNVRQEFDDRANLKGFNRDGHIGSVSDYFYDQSDGKFEVSFDVVGPVTVSRNMSYYGGNDSYGQDKNAEGLIEEACKLANKEVDFKDYDWNGDGEVEQVYVIYAGYGEAAGAAEETIWPHQYELPRAITLDGQRIQSYACSSELDGDSGTRLSGIGVICHEFSHCLGLPDFYDTDPSDPNNPNFGMSVWSVMDYGSYNGDARVPAAYTAYERWYMGWKPLIELDSPASVRNMKAITDGGDAYVIYNDAHRSECYILDNHQRSKWDKHAYGTGLLITHIDYDHEEWVNNAPNNVKSHPRVTIIPADGTRSDDPASWAGDPWPGSKGNTELTDTSKPAAKVYNRTKAGTLLMGKPITKITEKKGLISFDFMGGKTFELPTDLEAINVKTNSFTAQWQASSQAVSYDIELLTKNPQSYHHQQSLLETFSKLKGNSNGSDGSEDISTKLNDWLLQKGWSGKSLYRSEQRIKMRREGLLISPTNTAPADGEITVWIKGKPSAANQRKGYVTLRILNAAGEPLKQSIQALGENEPIVANFSGIKEDYKVELTAGFNIYFNHIGIYKGTYSTEQFEDPQYANAYTSLQVVEKVSETQHSFSNLESGEYAFRLRLWDNTGEQSGWTEMCPVSLVTGISIPTHLRRPTSERFNLSGQRVLPTWKGIYIENGQKHLAQ